MWNTVFCMFLYVAMSSQSLPLAICPILTGSGYGHGGGGNRATALLLKLEKAVVVEGVADVADRGQLGRLGRPGRQTRLPPDGLPVALLAFGLVMAVVMVLPQLLLPFCPSAPILLLGRRRHCGRLPLPLLLLLELRLADDVLQRSLLLLPLLLLHLTLLSAGFAASLSPRALGLVGGP